jgi:glycosyltransferase involved in cell wall biosynthesis
VILTVARLAGEERYKGFDEVLEALPQLALRTPAVSYLIVGDGPDRSRLEAKATTLRVRDRVIFAGFVSEEEKADHYRLADAFVMTGRGEGFGIVYLEALACGVPVVASTLDASREAVRDGLLGQVVDPRRREELIAAIVRAFSARESVPQADLEHFSTVQFRERWRAVLNDVVSDTRESARKRWMLWSPTRCDSYPEVR